MMGYSHSRSRLAPSPHSVLCRTAQGNEGSESNCLYIGLGCTRGGGRLGLRSKFASILLFLRWYTAQTFWKKYPADSGLLLFVLPLLCQCCYCHRVCDVSTLEGFNTQSLLGSYSGWYFLLFCKMTSQAVSQDG
jgi:hypothetical protein